MCRPLHEEFFVPSYCSFTMCMNPIPLCIPPPCILSLHINKHYLSRNQLSNMANPSALGTIRISLNVLVLLIHFDLCLGGTRKLASLYHPPTTLLKYHSGEMLEGVVPISIVWYGKFTSAQKSTIHDFLFSITPKRTATSIPAPSVSQWWKTVDRYLEKAGQKNTTKILLANQITDCDYSVGRMLTRSDVATLAGRVITGGKTGGVGVVLTASDVAVEGFCMSNCGFHSHRTAPDLTQAMVENCHGSYCTNSDHASVGRITNYQSMERFAYIWIGNSASQCPGKCAWPFHQPMYGPQVPPLVPPNNDVGLDGMVVNLATLLAGTVTNPFGDGLFQGPKEAPVEVAAVCPGVYGKGAYPGYAGDLLMDGITGASYNAHGLNGRKYLLPAMYDPSTSSCSTLV